MAQKYTNSGKKNDRMEPIVKSKILWKLKLFALMNQLCQTVIIGTGSLW